VKRVWMKDGWVRMRRSKSNAFIGREAITVNSESRRRY
jgi:hypothetical protein